MRTKGRTVLVLGALVLAATGCSKDEEAPAAPAAQAAAEGTAVEGCGGLRLLEGDRVQIGERTVDCGDLDQLLSDQSIDHTCLGAISHAGGRSCIERFVEASRGRSRVLQHGPVHVTPTGPPGALEPEPEP